MMEEQINAKSIVVALIISILIIGGGSWFYNYHLNETNEKQLQFVKNELKTCTDLENSYFWKSYLAHQTVTLLKRNVLVFHYVNNLAEECDLK